MLKETVQKDLQLTADQVAKLKDVVKTVDDSAKEAFAGIRDLSREERQAKRKEMREKMLTQTKDARKKVEAILTSRQTERFKQIRLQVAGAAAFLDAEVTKALDISEEQRGKLRDPMGKLWAERGDFRNLSQEERGKRLAEVREKAQKAIMEVLTPDQKTKLEEVGGEEDRVEAVRSDGGPGGGRF